MTPTLRRLEPALRGDFHRVHSEANSCGWCQCVAWWVPTWDGWGERTAEGNRALRQRLFGQGQDDGYLLYDGDEPVGWAQVGPRDRLAKLVAEYALTPEPGVWAATCFLLIPRARGRGWMRSMVTQLLADLPLRGAEALEAFPRRGQDLDDGAIWTGPEALFQGLGFERVQEHPRRPRYRRQLTPHPV